MKNNREILTLLFELSRITRSSQMEGAFYENITFLQFYILDLIGAKGTLKLSELHKALYVEKSTTTRLIEPLVKQNLIVKNKSLEDTRAIDLQLTENGERVHKSVWGCVDNYIEALEKELPAEKRDDICGSVQILLNALQKIKI